MRDPQRIDRILFKLRAAWHAAPDLRLGQLITNVAFDANTGTRAPRSFELLSLDYSNYDQHDVHHCHDPHSIEDDEFETALNSYLKQFSNKV